MAKTKPWYRKGYRRMLVDMHIPDWDEKFLSRYDPKQMADLYEKARLTSVMFYCQSHVGLCYWPTKTGKMHAGLKGRDVVAEMLAELKQRKIDPCAYYSGIYNNWAFLEHPHWRMLPAHGFPEEYGSKRYGHCCPNNPDYRRFILAQLEELVGGYDFKGIYIDMTFWPFVCVCRHCRERFRKEAGLEIPLAIDWHAPDWRRFQHCREKWLLEYTALLSGHVKKLKPEMSVYHNFAAGFSDWMRGVSFDAAAHHDFMGADLYGDSLEQLFVSKTMGNLSQNRPIEFQTSCCVDLTDHVRLKSYQTLEMQAFAAILFSSVPFFIEAINPDGTANPESYARVGRIFRETARYEKYLGGEPVEEIAVYFSDQSKMDFAEDGRPLDKNPLDWSRRYPHLAALRGVCRTLQAEHLPFGVITRKNLAALDRYRLVILPEVLSMDRAEAEQFRNYVRRGGRLYASCRTSLTDNLGVEQPDFMLADVFGCHFDAGMAGNMIYLKPEAKDIAECLRPQAYLSHRLTGTAAVRLRKNPEGRTLAALALPYRWPEFGSVFDHNWASIHSSPNWADTDIPALVLNRFGKGQSIYCAADIEAVDSEANGRLFRRLVETLLEGGGAPACTAATHSDVLMSVSHQPENKRFLVGFLNYQKQLPALPVERIPFTLRPPAGRKFRRLLLLPEKKELKFRTDKQGILSAEARDLSVFQMLLAEYR